MKINGGVIVLIGAISYGIPASLFKMATSTGILPANLLLSQVLFAAMILICIIIFDAIKLTTRLTILPVVNYCYLD